MLPVFSGEDADGGEEDVINPVVSLVYLVSSA